MAGAEDEDYLKHQRKLNTLFALPFYVNSPKIFNTKFGLILSTFYRRFSEFLVIIITAGQLVAVPHVYENMNILLGCLASGSYSAQVVFKTLLLSFHKKKYVDHLKKTHELQKEIDHFESFTFHRNTGQFREYHSKQSRYIRILSTVQIIVNFISTCGYYLPFVYDSIVNRDELDRQVTPVVIYMGFDFNFTPVFQIIVAIISLGFFIIDIKPTVIDFFIMNLLELHLCQLRYANNLLKQINSEFVNSDIGKSEIDETTIKKWIIKHQKLLRLISDFQKLMSPFLFVEFSYILIHSCVPALVITSTFSWTLPQKVSVFFMGGGSILIFFLMSHAGDAFCNEWYETGEDLFDSDISLEKEKTRKNIYLMIRKRVHGPIYFKALNSIPLNFASFLSLSRLIVSYYMALSQIQKLKRRV